MGPLNKTAGAHGFTLIELLISALLFGIVATMLYGLIVSAVNIHGRTADRLDLHRRTVTVGDWLENDLTNLDRAGLERLAIDSSSVEVSAFQTHTDSSGFSQLRYADISYAILVDEDSSVLLTRTVRYLNGDQDSATLRFPQSYTLRFETENIASLSVPDLSSGFLPNGSKIPISVRLALLEELASTRSRESVYEKNFILRGRDEKQ
jgi:prepilin-type N-terminal cleavage/methylation domain-containing protein